MSEDGRRESLSTRTTRLRTDGGDDADEPLGDLRRRIEGRRESDGAANGEESHDGDSGEPSETAATREADELADILDGRDEEATDPDADELFTEMSVDDVDTDAVWDAVLSEEEEAETVEVPTEETFIADSATDVSEGAAETEHIVPKKKYCESCRFFTSPPDVGCTYEDSAIVEVVNTTEFRVRNCPVVQGVVDIKGSPVEGEEAVPRESSSSN